MPPLLLYSTNTWLVFSLCEEYFQNKSYCWAAKDFDPSPDETYIESNPKVIYKQLENAFRNHNYNDPKYYATIVKMRKVIEDKIEAGTIPASKVDEVREIIARVQFDASYAKPLIYVICTLGVNVIERKEDGLVPPNRSLEYEIPELARDRFHILNIISEKRFANPGLNQDKCDN